jgi:hypothetical protein
VVIEKLKILEDKSLTEDQKDALKVFLGDVAAVRQLKQERK